MLQRREHHGTRPPHGRIDDRAVAAMPGADVAVDLIDQDDGIAHDHAGKRDQPEQCHEAERPAGDEQRPGRADQPKRSGCKYQRQPRETLQLNHQERQRHDGHHRKHGDQRTVGLDTFLDRSTSLDAIAVGQGVLDVLELRLHLLADVGGLHAVDDVAACGQHDVAVAAPQDRLLVFIVEARDLRQRHGDAIAADDGERRQTVELQPFGRDRARHHVDVLDAFAVLRSGVARQQRLQRLGNVLRRQSERAGAVLVDLEPDRLHLLAPVEVRVDDLGVLRHYLAHLFGDGPHLHRIRPDDAELDRETHGRAKHEAIDTHAGLRQDAVRDRTLQPGLDALARREVLGDDDDLRKIRIRQHRIESEPEARRSLPHIAGIGHDIGIADEQMLGPLRGRVGHADGGAFRKAQLEE